MPQPKPESRPVAAAAAPVGRAGSAKVVSTQPVAAPSDLVVMAHVKEPYGLKGWVKLYTHSESAVGLAGFGTWWINQVTAQKSPQNSAQKTDWRAVVPEQTSEHSGTLIAKLPGVEDRDAAFALKGLEIAVPRSGFAARGDNEFYWTELIGLSVTNRDGALLGSVIGLMDLGPHQVLRVQGAGQGDAGRGDERLIPFVAQYVDGVDLAAKTIRVDWGLDF